MCPKSRQGGTLLSVPKPICPILDILILDARTREKVGYIQSGREARQKVKETGDFVHLFENSKSSQDRQPGLVKDGKANTDTENSQGQQTQQPTIEPTNRRVEAKGKIGSITDQFFICSTFDLASPSSSGAASSHLRIPAHFLDALNSQQKDSSFPREQQRAIANLALRQLEPPTSST